MSTTNRLKNRVKHAQSATSTDNQKQQQSPIATPTLKSQSSISSHMGGTDRRVKAYNVSTHSKQTQKQYEEYAKLVEGNPIGITSSMGLLPHSADMNDNCNVPLGFVFSPMLALENQSAQVMEKNIDTIPRCSTCTAYMNYYNTIEKKKFVCFLCNRTSFMDQKYNPSEQSNLQLQSTIYQALASPTFYQKEPLEQAFIFMVDISQQAFNSKMLYYATAAMKEVLARQDLDDMVINLYAFDELVYHYDFTGEDITCHIMDQTIEATPGSALGTKTLKDIRNNLFLLLNQLQQICKLNQRKGYNFSKCFDFIFTTTKHLGGKYFIFQANQAWATDPMFMEKNQNQKDNQPATKSQGVIETTNRVFFDKYVMEAMRNDCTFAFFSFAATYRNYRTIHDAIKLTCSQMKIYSKDSVTDLQKFYYELSYLLGTTYFKNVFLELIVSSGWNLNGLYGNYHRIKDQIRFQMNALEPSRKLTVIVNPAPNVQLSPFCGLQIIVNYRYKRQSFVTIATYIQPITGYMDKLYSQIDPVVSIVCLSKKFLSVLRVQPIESVRKKLIELSRKIYISALEVFKKHENLPDSLVTILMSALSMLKSSHGHPQLMVNTPAFDRMIGERNSFQFSGQSQVTNYFNPYLFDLTNMDDSMCQQSQFVYPPTLQVKFENTKEGLFLLDNGVSLTLFIAKQCDPQILQQVFGMPKLTKHDTLNQELLNQQDTTLANQIKSLIRVLRQQKGYGWVPLYIVRCGEKTLNERNFYLNFHLEKYEEFKVYKMSFEEFLAMLIRPGNF